MENEKVIKSISKQGNGEIYLGIVGSVRSGKSTFIKRVIEKMIVPSIENKKDAQKILDEIPQCGQGKMIMTTEPKFVPSSTCTIKVNDFTTNIKMVDCVGYVINDSTGFLDEDGNPRMVKTPWLEDYIPLTEAAEIGTQKVIKDHATIGIVITSDGSITDIDRNNYVDAENRCINELKEIGKPFIIVLNSRNIEDVKTINLARELESTYDVPVLLKNVDKLSVSDINEILEKALYEFPVENLKINIPKWIDILPSNHEIKRMIISSIEENIININKLKDSEKISELFLTNEYISKVYVSNFDPDNLTFTINIDVKEELFEKELEKYVSGAVSKSSLLELFIDKDKEKSIKNITSAVKMAKNTGYGIVYPTLTDLHLDTPEIIKEGSRFGVKLKASASSIHMIKVDVESNFEPIIGSEAQAKELIDYIMKDYDKDKESIWSSEIFGRSLEQIVKEGIEAKLSKINDGTRVKLSNTVTKIVNKGANNLIAIVI